MGVATVSPIEIENFVIERTLPLLIMLTVATFFMIRIPLTRLGGIILFSYFILFIYQLTLYETTYRISNFDENAQHYGADFFELMVNAAVANT